MKNQQVSSCIQSETRVTSLLHQTSNHKLDFLNKEVVVVRLLNIVKNTKLLS